MSFCMNNACWTFAGFFSFFFHLEIQYIFIFVCPIQREHGPFVVFLSAAAMSHSSLNQTTVQHKIRSYIIKWTLTAWKLFGPHTGNNPSNVPFVCARVCACSLHGCKLLANTIASPHTCIHVVWHFLLIQAISIALWNITTKFNQIHYKLSSSLTINIFKTWDKFHYKRILTSSVKGDFAPNFLALNTIIVFSSSIFLYCSNLEHEAPANSQFWHMLSHWTQTLFRCTWFYIQDI